MTHEIHLTYLKRDYLPHLTCLSSPYVRPFTLAHLMCNHLPYPLLLLPYLTSPFVRPITSLFVRPITSPRLYPVYTGYRRLYPVFTYPRAQSEESDTIEFISFLLLFFGARHIYFCRNDLLAQSLFLSSIGSSLRPCRITSFHHSFVTVGQTPRLKKKKKEERAQKREDWKSRGFDGLLFTRATTLELSFSPFWQEESLFFLFVLCCSPLLLKLIDVSDIIFSIILWKSLGRKRENHSSRRNPFIVIHCHSSSSSSSS